MLWHSRNLNNIYPIRPLCLALYAISLVLIRVDSGIQRPVYYVSKSLNEAEVLYLSLEKAILSVVLATRKLPHYFQAHTVVVLTQLPLKSVLGSADYTGRIAKWGTILKAFDIKYMPRTSIKGQVLADLVAEFAECPEEMKGKIRNWEQHQLVWYLSNAQCLGNCTSMGQRTSEDQGWG